MVIISSSMIRMTWIKVQGSGCRGSPLLPSYLPSFLSCFLCFSFLPSFPYSLLPWHSFLPSGDLHSFLFIVLPSFLASFFSFLPSFLSPGIPSFLSCFFFSPFFLPSFIALKGTPPAKKKIPPPLLGRMSDHKQFGVWNAMANLTIIENRLPCLLQSLSGAQRRRQPSSRHSRCCVLHRPKHRAWGVPWPPSAGFSDV